MNNTAQSAVATGGAGERWGALKAFRLLGTYVDSTLSELIAWDMISQGRRAFVAPTDGLLDRTPLAFKRGAKEFAVV